MAPLKDSASDQRGGNDLLLQEIPDGLVAYRMVLHNPAVESDFHSHYERGVPPRPGMPFRAFQWFGVSLFLDRARAERLTRRAYKQGAEPWVATLRMTSGAGLWGIYTAATTHLEVFAVPQDLLARVDEVS
jgi:hypothetical protein